MSIETVVIYDHPTLSSLSQYISHEISKNQKWKQNFASENVPSLNETIDIFVDSKNKKSSLSDKAKEKKPGIEKLKDHLNGMPSLMFTKENPFRLAANLMKSKSKAPAKAGQVAPSDIVVEAGPTGFAPGPVIGELGQLGIKTSVENGKVAIKENKVLVKKGEKIAQIILTRYEEAKIQEVNELTDSIRGEGGFGSTGLAHNNNI